MKEYVVIIDPFVMDQHIYECIEGQLKLVENFQLTKIETYTPLLNLLNYAKNEQVIINLKCPKAFISQVKEKIYTYCSKMDYEKNNIIIKDI